MVNKITIYTNGNTSPEQFQRLLDTIIVDVGKDYMKSFYDIVYNVEININVNQLWLSFSTNSNETKALDDTLIEQFPKLFFQVRVEDTTNDTYIEYNILDGVITQNEGDE